MAKRQHLGTPTVSHTEEQNARKTQQEEMSEEQRTYEQTLDQFEPEGEKDEDEE